MIKKRNGGSSGSEENKLDVMWNGEKMFKEENLVVEHINVVDDNGNIVIANLKGVNMDINSDDIAHRFDFASEANLLGNNSKVYYKFKGANND